MFSKKHTVVTCEVLGRCFPKPKPTCWRGRRRKKSNDFTLCFFFPSHKPSCPRSFAVQASGVPPPVPPPATPASASSRAFPGARGTGAVSRDWPARSSGRGGSCLAPSFRATPTGAWSPTGLGRRRSLAARACAWLHACTDKRRYYTLIIFPTVYYYRC